MGKSGARWAAISPIEIGPPSHECQHASKRRRCPQWCQLPAGHEPGPGGRIHVHIVAKLRREGSTLRASRSPRDLARFIRDALFEAARRLEAVAVAKFG
jgi:hypothetical protein